MESEAIFAKVEALYAKASRVDRAIIRSRFPQIAAELIDTHVPERGMVVDLGCGRGELLNYLHFSHRERDLLGVDLAEGKIAIAQSTIGDRAGIRFAVGDIRTAEFPRCDCVILSQVLYLLSFSDQEALLKRCAGMINGGGVLIASLFLGERKTAFITFCFRASDRILSVLPAGIRNPLKRLRARLFGERPSRPSFRSPDEYERLLCALGMTIEKRYAVADGTLPAVTGGSGAVIVARKM